MKDLLSVYAPEHRKVLLAVAAASIAGIATIDFVTKPFVSIGFLYLFPIMIVGGFLGRSQIAVVAIGCAILQEAFSSLPESEAVVRLVLSSAGFTGTGLFISELIRNRHIVLRHVSELEEQEKRRKDAEQELQYLVDTSPAAIITIRGNGRIDLANAAAHRLFEADSESLRGQSIESYLPSLHAVVRTHSSKVLRTALQCRGQRRGGDGFLAGVWFSTYMALDGPRLAAIVVDLSEDLRNREDLSLDHLLKSARILMSAVAHEVRNLCSAALVVHRNLSSIDALASNEDFQALRTLIQSLDTVLTLELQPSDAPAATSLDLTSMIDEVRVLMEAAYGESQMQIDWRLPRMLPPVIAERYGLIQVFLNLAKNSLRAMESTLLKRLRVSASEDGSTVTIRFEDTGIGVSSPERLFHPFQPGAVSTGLGLYVSRAIVRSFGGDLVHEPRLEGACFAVVLAVAHVRDSVNA